MGPAFTLNRSHEYSKTAYFWSYPENPALISSTSELFDKDRSCFHPSCCQRDEHLVRGSWGWSTDTNVVTSDGACSVHLESHTGLRDPPRPVLCHDTMCLPILAWHINKWKQLSITTRYCAFSEVKRRILHEAWGLWGTFSLLSWAWAWHPGRRPGPATDRWP